METDTTTQGQTPAQAANSVRLLFDQGLSAGEIAEELGIPLADVMRAIPLATLACGHDILVTPAQEDAGKAFHCGQFRDITRLPGKPAEREQAGPRLAPLADSAAHARRVLADYKQRAASGAMTADAPGDDSPFYQLGSLSYVLEALLMSVETAAL